MTTHFPRRSFAMLVVLTACVTTMASCSSADPASTTTTDQASSTTADPASLPVGSLLALAVLDEGELLIIDSGGREVVRLSTPDGTQVRSLYQPPGADLAVGVTLNGFVFTLDLDTLTIVGGGTAPTPRFYPQQGFGRADGGVFVMEFPEERIAAVVDIESRSLAGAAMAEYVPGQLYLLRMNQPGTAALVSTDVGEFLVDFTKDPIGGLLLEATGGFSPAGDELVLVAANGEVTRTTIDDPFGGTVVATDGVPPVGIVGDNVVYGLAGGGLQVIGGSLEAFTANESATVGIAVAPDGSGAIVVVPDGYRHLSASGDFTRLDALTGMNISAVGSQAIFLTGAGGTFAVVSVLTGQVLAEGEEASAAFHAASLDGRFVGVQGFDPLDPLSLLIDVETGRVEELAGKAMVSDDGTQASFLTPNGPAIAPLADIGSQTVIGPPGSTWWLTRAG
jgi:hypothetical protein